jgi:crossover junction endodeoxyribonuclease RusA
VRNKFFSEKNLVELKLPMPPSANAIWRSNRGHVHKSAAYKAWLTVAGWQVRSQHPNKIEGPYKLSIEAVRPDKRRRDIDNLIKPVSDLLCSIGVIEDDCYCEKVSAEWITEGDGVTVRIEGLEMAA